MWQTQHMYVHRQRSFGDSRKAVMLAICWLFLQAALGAPSTRQPAGCAPGATAVASTTLRLAHGHRRERPVARLPRIRWLQSRSGGVRSVGTWGLEAHVEYAALAQRVGPQWQKRNPRRRRPPQVRGGVLPHLTDVQ